MDFRLLGPLEVFDQDRPLDLGAAKQRSLLALLLLNANEVVSTDRLIAELRGDSPPSTVAKSVQVYVSRLCKEFPAGGPPREGPVVVPFGAATHDWAALELAAWIARATGAPLRLIGAAADHREDGRDASRLLADASLMVQRGAGGLAPDGTGTRFGWSLTGAGA